MPGHGPRVITREELRHFFLTVLPGSPLDDYPYLLEHGEQHITEGSHKEEGEFEFGLRLILDGLKRIRGAESGGHGGQCR
jgi:hypothetical protein